MSSLQEGPPEDPSRIPGLPTLTPEFRKRYAILRALGRGGSGVVVAARDLELGRDVAIKFLSLRSISPESPEVQRFIREARVLGAVQHPNLVKVFDFHLEEKFSYIVSELVEGETLDALLAREGTLNPDRVRRLALSVVDGLDALHSQGIVHRDIKPSNILVTPAGFRILDLGVVHLPRPEGDAGLTRSGHLVGTPLYCAPEQIDGHQVEAPADFYSLGLVLYECLTGQKAFPGSLVLVLAAKARGEIPSMEPLQGLPEHITRFLRSLLEPDPAKRPARGDQLKKRLERRWSDRPTARTAQDEGSQDGRRPRAGTILRVLGGTAALALVGLFLHYKMFAPRIGRLVPELGLRGISVHLERNPAGPVSLRVLRSDGSSRELSSSVVTDRHRFRVEDLAPGDAVTLVPFDGLHEGPPLDFRHEAAGCRSPAIRRQGAGLEVEFTTVLPVRSRLGCRRGAEVVWIDGAANEGTEHRFQIDAKHLPFSLPLRALLVHGSEQIEEDLAVDGSSEAAFLRFAGEWTGARLEAVGRSVAECLAREGEKAGGSLLMADRVRIREELARAEAGLPEIGFLAGLGGARGILDHLLIAPSEKDAFYQALHPLDTLRAAQAAVGASETVGLEKVFGAHFGPSLASAYPAGQEYPIKLTGVSPGTTLRLSAPPATPGKAGTRDRFEGTVRIVTLPQGARAELAVRSTLIPHRQIAVLVNGTYHLLVGYPPGQFRAGKLDFHVAFDSRYLRVGENRFEFTVAPFPPLIEGFVDRELPIEVDGFRLRIQSP